MLRDAAKRIVVAASRLLGAAAACVILLSFAAEHRKSYWNGCIHAAIVICQQIFSTLALVIFLLKIILKMLQNRFFPSPMVFPLQKGRTRVRYKMVWGEIFVAEIGLGHPFL